MTLILVRGLLLALLLSSAPPAARAGISPSAELPDLVEKILPGVVNVSSTTISETVVYGLNDFFQLYGIPRQSKQSSLGSGFIIDAEKGLVLTNHHVVRHATEVQVILIDKKTYPARIVGHDSKLDLAVLKISDNDRKVPAGLRQVPLGDSDKVRIAESVFAVGNPFSLQHTVTTGIISAKNRTIGMGPFDNFLQTDASINPGNSGGPLFNLKGEVIGINTAIFSKTGQSGGLGFATPINAVKAVVADLVKYGRVPRPWLGIMGQGNNPQLAQYHGLGTNQGVVLFDLINGGPAARAGLRPGDVITEVDGQKVADPHELERQILKKKPNESTTLRVMRGRRSLDSRIKLTEVPDEDRLPPGTI